MIRVRKGIITMKKTISVILCAAVAASLAAGCSTEETKPAGNITLPNAVSAETSADTTAASGGESDATGQSETKSNFEFKTKVCSSYMRDIYGQEKCDAWFSLVDAVMAGEDTFDCPDSNAYVWVIRDFPDRCFPVLSEIVEEDTTLDRAKINGPTKFKYKIPKEEAAQKIEEFEQIVTDIINEAVKPGYTDFEKVLALYMYFPHVYTYDYDEARAIDDHDVAGFDLSTYHLMITKTGVCAALAQAYSYLLMQLDIDASVVISGEHEWSIINLYGKNYHIDPTAVLNSWDNMEYFMMTDEQRGNTGYPKDNGYTYVSEFSPEEEPDYSATDDKFSDLWRYRVESFDTKTGKLNYYLDQDDGSRETGVFEYRGY